MDAVKFADPHTVLALSNVEMNETGYVYRWRWRSADPPERVNDVRSGTHDVQLAFGRGARPASYWQSNGPAVFEADLATGAVARSYDLEGTFTINHAQLLREDTYALVSARTADAVVLFDVENATFAWIAGGDHGTLGIDANYTALEVVEAFEGGDPYAARPWAGQHNVEAFGDRIYMFDNALDQGLSSRVLRFFVDGGRAVIDWVYELPFPFPYGYSEVYGDADLLPSGNVLTNWWPKRLSPAAGVAADVYYQEITPDHRVAWEMAVYNTGETLEGRCVREASPGCERDIYIGWKTYSVERFWDAPVVYDVEPVVGGLAFVAHSAIKLQHETPGRWDLLDDAGAVLATGAFDFAAHHLARRVRVAATPTAQPLAAATLRVTDGWGQSADTSLDGLDGWID